MRPGATNSKLHRHDFRPREQGRFQSPTQTRFTMIEAQTARNTPDAVSSTKAVISETNLIDETGKLWKAHSNAKIAVNRPGEESKVIRAKHSKGLHSLKSILSKPGRMAVSIDLSVGKGSANELWRRSQNNPCRGSLDFRFQLQSRSLAWKIPTPFRSPVVHRSTSVSTYFGNQRSRTSSWKSY